MRQTDVQYSIGLKKWYVVFSFFFFQSMNHRRSSGTVAYSVFSLLQLQLIHIIVCGQSQCVFHVFVKAGEFWEVPMLM